MFDQETSDLARTIWDYHHMNQPLEKADVILVLGGHDLRVPEYAAKLYGEGYAPIIVVSGGTAHNDDLLKTGWDKTEAETFKDVLVRGGVPTDKILVENEAKNTGDNFILGKKTLDEARVDFQSAIVVTKPYMERRAFATGAKQWPDKTITVTSPPTSFEDYFSHYVNQETSPEAVLNIMMGDLQRIEAYGKNGFQIPQEIPELVREAFRKLKLQGYTKHLLADVNL